ncbi:hypothetical protein [Janthinobacterium sp. MDT1-19]|uniref:hypothetical protein n=1 Tax=Janthinobacterium sp. MDT1-19 TaxID=1259339 RepID=UPI003F25137C
MNSNDGITKNSKKQASAKNIIELPIATPVGSLSYEPGAQLPTPPLFDIIAEDGSVLWHARQKVDARRLIKNRQALPEQYPRWQGRLATLPANLAPTGSISTKQDAPRCFTGFPPGALDGCQPTLQFRGGSLGFGDDRPDVMIGFGGQVGHISAELALFHLDRFIESSRAQLILMAGYHYGVTLECPTVDLTGGMA